MDFVSSWCAVAPSFAPPSGVRTVAAIPAAGLLLGSALGMLAPDQSPFIGLTLLCASAAAAVWAWCAARAPVLVVAISLAFLGGGAALAAAAWDRAWRPPLRPVFEDRSRATRRQLMVEGRAPPLDDQAFMVVEGVLRADASPAASGVSLNIDVDRVENPSNPPNVPGPPDPDLGGITVTVIGSIAQERITEWRAGRRVRFPAQLRRAARYLNPGVPDLERALARRGTRLVGTVKSGALVEVISAGGRIDQLFAAARASARRAIAAAVGRWSGRSAAIVGAIVIGDRAGLDARLERRLQEAGTYHVIAISGGNIAILAGLLIGLFRVAGALGPAAMIAAILTLLAYARFVGGGPSVERATLMAVVYLAARALDHRSAPLNALAVVAACLVATGPLSAADPGFLLTCGATLAIVAAVPTVHAPGLPRLARLAVLMLAASVATEALLFPVGAFVFSRVTFAGLALNFLAIPLMGVAQVAGMAVIPAAAVSGRLAAAFGWFAHVGAEGLVQSAELIRFAPWTTWRVAAPGIFIVIAYYAGLATWWALWRRAREGGGAEPVSARRWRHASLAAAAVAAFWILAQPWTLLASRGDGRLRVTFIDVGQGDATLVRFPGGATLLVDAGGLPGASPFDIGDRVVAPVLREAGVRRLDYLALTHGDPDHIGGAASVIGEFRPREIWEGIPVPRSVALSGLRGQAEAAGLHWAAVRRGDRFWIAGVEVRVLHPGEPDWERQKVRNDDSLVVELRWRDVSIVLPGDIGRDTERELPPLGPSRLRVLKAAHHGSLTSSSESFIRAARPTHVVFSAGRSNTFGHPAPAVVERYEAVGAEIFRTDRDGAVTIDTDGYSLGVRTFSGNRRSLRRQ